MHPDEKQNYIREEHSYPLVVGLTPHIDVVHIEQVKIKILQIIIIIQKKFSVCWDDLTQIVIKASFTLKNDVCIGKSYKYIWRNFYYVLIEVMQL